MILGPERRLKMALAFMAAALVLLVALGVWVVHQDYSHVEHAAQDEAARNLSRIVPDLQRGLEAALQKSLSAAKLPWQDRQLHSSLQNWQDGVVCELGRRGELLKPAMGLNTPQPPDWYINLGEVQRVQLDRLESGSMSPEAWKQFRDSITNHPGLNHWVNYQIWLQDTNSAENVFREGVKICDGAYGESPSGVPIHELVLWHLWGRLIPVQDDAPEIVPRMNSAMGHRPTWMMKEILKSIRDRVEAGRLSGEWQPALIQWEMRWKSLEEVQAISLELTHREAKRGGAERDGIWVDGLADGMMAFRLGSGTSESGDQEGRRADRSFWWMISKAHFEEMVDQTSKTALRGLPPYLVVRLEGGGMVWNCLPGVVLATDVTSRVLAQGDFVLEGDLSSMRFHIALGLRDPGLLYAQYRTRLYWMLVMMVASLGFVGFAVWTVVQAFRQQARLQEEQQNFIASVSHELRAPLAAVSLMTENLAGDKVDEVERRADYLQRMLRECRRLSGMVENVLDFSRIQRGRQTYEKEPTDVGSVLEHTVALMRENAERQSVRLEWGGDLTPGLEAYWDGRAVHQALINLIDNAIKHSPVEGKVGVRALVQGLNRIRIEVADEGPGIPVAERERIFERFHRLGSELRRETPGIGIGLSLVKHVVESHGGRVWAESDGMRGSCFVMELPLGEQSGKKEGVC